MIACTMLQRSLQKITRSGASNAYSSATRGSCAPANSLRPAPLQPRTRGFTSCRAWQQVMDPASGKPYYWNTQTDETTWELPSAAEVLAMATRTAERLSNAISACSSYMSTSSSSSSSSDSSYDDEYGHMTFDELYNILVNAYDADNSGAVFWETARAHRSERVFEEEFFEFLSDRIDADDDAEMAQKVRARLSRPVFRR